MAKLLQMPLLFELFGAPETLNEPAEPANLVDPNAPELAPMPDAAERERALDIHRSWIVEAPAGSGKTGLLIQRFLKLLAYGGVEQPNEVLAITFTRKADAEMRRRVLAQLAAAAEDQPLPPAATTFDRNTRQIALAVLDRDRALSWRLLEAPQTLNIRTIDSLCAELAGSTPLLAGTGGRHTPTADPDPFYAEAAQRTLLLMGGSDPVLTADLESLLLHRDASPGDFCRLLADMLKQREQWGELIPLDPNLLTEQALNEGVRPRLTRTLERLLTGELQTAADLVGPDLLHSLAALAHTLSACPPYNGDDPHPLHACTQRSAAPGNHSADFAHWRCLIDLVLTAGGQWRAGFNKNNVRLVVSPGEKLELQYLVGRFRERERTHPTLLQTLVNVRSLPSAPYPEEQWGVVKSLCRVLRQALVELSLVFAERRTCDFTEVALTARTLLRTDPAGTLQTSVGRLKHLLVDEMQDTSASQYELLETLTRDWNGVTQTLLLVGDPKQSIYEFRQARVERFLRVMREGRLGRLPLGALHLTANFRSQAALVDDLNSTFREILPSPEDLALSPESVEVPFIAAHATRPAANTPALHWRLARKEPNARNAQPGTAASQARQIRNTIEERLSRAKGAPAQPRIAVLARSRSHLDPIIYEFHQDRGSGRLPFRAVDIEPLGERPEILDLLALTRTLLHPGDRVAWLALLRSPVCGLDLADLLALTGEGAGADLDATLAHLIATRGHDLSLNGTQRLGRTWSVLGRALDDLGRTPLATHVERTWRSLGADAPLGAHERANARRFLNLLHELESGPDPLSLSLLNRRLRKLYAGPDRPDAPVELMTIHKAKGLEWDLVLIPSLHSGSGRGSHEFLKWLEFDSSGDGAASAGFLLAPIACKGDDTSDLSSWLSRRQCQREAAEAKRLLYVACTRAREELHLFAAVTLAASGALADPRPSSLLKAAWPVAQPLAANLLPPAHPGGDVLAFPAAPQTDPLSEPLALAAAAADPQNGSQAVPTHRPDPTPAIRRLPLHLDPLSRFRPAAGPLLAYPAAATLQREAAFARPEASFAARAFGNVVHRFLAVLASRLSHGQALAALRAELPSWETRVLTSLRTEGLAPVQVAAEAQRVLQALISTLQDPAGAWLLAPHAGARNEAPIGGPTGGAGSPLRADRSFRAGAQPLSTGSETHLWIIDYKTAELGGRSSASFLADQRSRYRGQMEAYALAAAASGHDPHQIILALFFPLVPALLHWPATPQDGSEVATSV